MNEPEVNSDSWKVDAVVVATAMLLLTAELVWLGLLGWWFARLL